MPASVPLLEVGIVFAHVLWQATLIAFLLFVTLRLGRRWRPASRYRAAVAAYVLVAAIAGLAALGIVPVPTQADRPLGIVGIPRAVHDDPQATFVPPDLDALRADVATLQHAAPNASVRPADVTAGDGTRMGARPIADPLVSALGAAWVAAALFGLARLAWAARRAHALVRSSDPVPSHLEARFRALSHRCGLTDRVELRSSETISVPCAVGGRRPVVLLPVGIERELAREQLDAIILHELIHIQRRDTKAAAVQATFDAVFWFHPAARWISAQVHATREVTVDATVVATAVRATSYARALFALSERAHARESALTASTGGQLADRIGRLVGQEPARVSTRPRGPFLAALVVAGCGAWIVAAASEGYEANVHPTEPEAAWTWLTAKGSIELDVGTPPGIVAIEPGGWFRIDERRVDGVRTWRAAPGDGGDVRVAYFVDGAPAEFDAEAESALVAALVRASTLPRFDRLGGTTDGWSHAKGGDPAGDLVSIAQFDARDPDAVHHLVTSAIGRVRDAALRPPDAARSSRAPDVAHHTEVALILIHQLASHDAIGPDAFTLALERLEAALASGGP